MSGKTIKLIKEVTEYVINNPQGIIYTNSRLVLNHLKNFSPETKVELIKTLPDKTYPNIFWEYGVNNMKTIELTE